MADFVASLPNGFDTTVGDRGATLSGGQRQRLALARVLLKDAPILVLDEPTSNLDAESERVVQQAVQRLFASRTSIVVSHRPELLAGVDAILVLNDGGVEAFGPPHIVSVISPTYTRLFGSGGGLDP